MLTMQAVSQQYTLRGKTVNALDNVTFEVPAGDFVAVVGPSGSGKSTLLLALGGMLSPASGEICLNGTSLYRLDPEQRAQVRREKIGFLFQTFNLVPYLSAMENVKIPLMLGGLSPAAQGERAAALLERVGLAERLDHKPRELSVGQQQRVALARMLANDPPVILADEPTGNLDPETRDEIMDFLQALHREGRTIVMVTHDPQVTQRAKRCLRIVDGAVSEAAPAVREVLRA